MQIKISTESLDALSPECLVLGLFSDDRPPRGPCGFADWRLNGLISNLIASGRITGALRENVMIDTCRRIPAPKLILHGLGPLAGLTLEALHEAGLHLAATLTGLRCRDFAFDVPAATRAGLDVAQMTESLIRGFFDGLLSGSADAAGAMNRSPKTIAAGAFATEALRLMEEKKITSLFIVDGDGRPGGIVHLHDLWGVESI